jgi:DNA-binding winged helix-turn-helix (wHTH) protein/TolB-like protein/Tfp pilus assembly protein PilF
MHENKGLIYEFGNYRLDAGTRSLWLRGELVALSPKLFDLLSLLVERSPNIVSRQEILDTVWPETFVEESNINYTVSLLRKALEIKDAVTTVPRRGYRLSVEVRPVLETASLRPSQNGSAPDGSIKVSPFTFRYYWLALPLMLISVLLLVSFGLPFWPNAGPERASLAVRNIRTIAVLPFDNSSATNDESNHSFLMTSEVITRLGSLGGINVRPYDAVVKFAGRRDPVSAGVSLNVDAVITGEWVANERGAGVEIRLIDVRDGAEVWFERIEIPDPDSTDLHPEVASRIAVVLMKHISDADRQSLGKRYTNDPEAYKFYIRGRARFERSRPGAFEEILDNYNKAISLDPTFALAYAGLADLFFRRGNSLEGDESMAAYRRAEVFARKAAELDPELSQAHTAMGRVHRQINRDFVSAEESFRRAIALNPNNVFAYGYLGQIMILRGDPAEAIKLTHRIAEIDPTAHPVIFLRYRGFEALRDHETGLKYAEEAFFLDKQVAYARIFYAKFLFYNGQYERMAEVAREGLETHSGFAFVWHQLLASAALRTGDTSALSESLAALEKGAESSTKHLYWLAVVMAEQGRTEEVFAALNKCFENHEAWMTWIGSEPGFDNIRNDPRYTELVSKLNLPTS